MTVTIWGSEIPKGNGGPFTPDTVTPAFYNNIYGRADSLTESTTITVPTQMTSSGARLAFFSANYASLKDGVSVLSSATSLFGGIGLALPNSNISVMQRVRTVVDGKFDNMWDSDREVWQVTGKGYVRPDQDLQAALGLAPMSHTVIDDVSPPGTISDETLTVSTQTTYYDQYLVVVSFDPSQLSLHATFGYKPESFDLLVALGEPTGQRATEWGDDWLGSYPPGFFTNQADVVNFNDLTEEQVSSLNGIFDDESLYNSLSGSDSITLPEKPKLLEHLEFERDRLFRAGAGNDTIIGSAGNDRIEGGEHADFLSGGSNGENFLVGGKGTDRLLGAGKKDVLVAFDMFSVAEFAASEADHLTGAGGKDIFILGNGSRADDVKRLEDNVYVEQAPRLDGLIAYRSPKGLVVAQIDVTGDEEDVTVFDKTVRLSVASHATVNVDSGLVDPDRYDRTTFLRVGGEPVADAKDRPLLHLDFVSTQEINTRYLLTAREQALAVAMDAKMRAARDLVVEALLGDAPSEYASVDRLGRKKLTELGQSMADKLGSTIIEKVIKEVLLNEKTPDAILKTVLQGDQFLAKMPSLSWTAGLMDLADVLYKSYQGEYRNKEQPMYEGLQAVLGLAGRNFLSLGVALSRASLEVLFVKALDAYTVKVDKTFQELFEPGLRSPNGIIQLGTQGNNSIDFSKSDVDRVYFAGAGNDRVRDGFGDSDFIAGAGNGDDAYFGGGGRDTIRFESAQSTITVDLLAKGAQARGKDIGRDRVVEIENVVAGSGADRISGDGRSNLIDGRSGNDRLVGRDGADTLIGNDGKDLLIGGKGADLLVGGGGRDTAQYSSSVTVDLLDPGKSTGEAKGDRLVGVEVVLGSRGGDRLLGDQGANRLLGGGGRDTLNGRDGNDRLDGGSGNDILQGGVGADVVVGGSGSDRMNAGSDAQRDVFVFTQVSHSAAGSGRDLVTGFVRGQDDIDLRAIDARTSGSRGDDDFAWSGRTAKAHAVWWATAGDDVVVRADVSGDARADLEILIRDVSGWSARDLLL